MLNKEEKQTSVGQSDNEWKYTTRKKSSTLSNVNKEEEPVKQNSPLLKSGGDVLTDKEENKSDPATTLLSLKKSNKFIVSARRVSQIRMESNPSTDKKPKRSDPQPRKKFKSFTSTSKKLKNNSESPYKKAKETDLPLLSQYESAHPGVKNIRPYRTGNMPSFNRKKNNGSNTVTVDTKYFSNTEHATKRHSKTTNIPLNNKKGSVAKDFSARKIIAQKKCHLPLNNNEDRFVSRRSHLRQKSKRNRNPSTNPGMKNNNQPPSNLLLPKKRAKSENRSGQRQTNTLPDIIKELVPFIQERSQTLPSFDIANVSLKRFGSVASFAVNTHKGLVRVANEDRVSILLNAQTQLKKKPTNNLRFSLFSVFDGHGGSSCSNFLKNNLHNKLVEFIDFEKINETDIKDIYLKIDNLYIKEGLKERRKMAGSTSNTLITVNDRVFVVNTGDSRTIFSAEDGKKVFDGSKDHKPDCLSEFNRILEAGGELYRMSYNVRTGQNQFYFVKNINQFNVINELKGNVKQLAFGPWRVKPGGLSLSRSFGDVASKLKPFGGIEGVITSEPDITDFPVDKLDFAIIGCRLNSGWSF